MADFRENLCAMVGDLALQLTTAKTRIQELEAKIETLQEGKAAKESPPHDAK